MKGMVEIAEIKVGKRHRKDMGDLDTLAESMRLLGLLQPIGVTEEHELVFGQRRLRAAKKLGWDKVPVRYIKVDKLLAEQDENEVRKQFTVSERVSIAEAIRAKLGSRQGKRSDKLPDLDPEVPKGVETREHAAKKAGFDGDFSFRQAKVVVDKGTPDLVRAMDSGRLSPTVASKLTERPAPEQERVAQAVLEGKTEREAMRELNRDDRIRKLSEIAKGSMALDGSVGRHPILYVDPPWRYEHAESESRAIENQYPTMELEEICSLDVATITTDDCVLFCWATSPKLAEAMHVLERWGFTYRTCMVWDKEKIGMGYYARQQHELLLIATKGQPPAPAPEARPPSVIREKRGEHSAKPARFYELIEAMYPELPKLELFCRSPRAGWSVWGNQSAA